MHVHNVQMQSIVQFLRIILSSSEISLLSVGLDVPPVLEIILKFAWHVKINMFFRELYAKNVLMDVKTVLSMMSIFVQNAQMEDIWIQENVWNVQKTVHHAFRLLNVLPAKEVSSLTYRVVFKLKICVRKTALIVTWFQRNACNASSDSYWPQMVNVSAVHRIVVLHVMPVTLSHVQIVWLDFQR